MISIQVRATYLHTYGLISVFNSWANPLNSQVANLVVTCLHANLGDDFA